MDSMTGIIAILLISLFSVLGLWLFLGRGSQGSAIIFMVLAPLSLVAGFSAPDIISSTATTTELDITVALALVVYGLLCAAWSLRILLWSEA